MKYRFKPAFPSTRDNVKCKECGEQIEKGDMLMHDGYLRLLCHQACAEKLISNSDGEMPSTDLSGVISVLEKMLEVMVGKVDYATESKMNAYGNNLNEINAKLTNIETRLTALEGMWQA